MDILDRTPVPPTLPPGIYHDDPPEMRCAWDCPRISDIVAVAQGYSLAYVRYWMLHRKPSTPAMQSGTLLHMAVLEHHRWATEIGDAPINPKTGKPYGQDTKAYAEALEEWRATFPHGQLLTPDQKAEIERWRDAIYRCPQAQDLMSTTPFEWRECTMVWQDPTTGLTLRVRLDSYSPEFQAPWDIKTSAGKMAKSGLIPSELQRTIDEHGYDLQDVLYCSALQELGIPATAFWFVFLDKDNANEVVCRRLSEDYRDMAYRDMVAALAQLAEAYATNHWPSYSNTIDWIEPRRWRRRTLA